MDDILYFAPGIDQSIPFAELGGEKRDLLI